LKVSRGGGGLALTRKENVETTLKEKKREGESSRSQYIWLKKGQSAEEKELLYNLYGKERRLLAEWKGSKKSP